MTNRADHNSEDHGAMSRELVPVKNAASASRRYAVAQEAAPSCKPARSPFLTQLSRQYESRDEASIRRSETRSKAQQSYRARPKPAQTRHIVWA